MKIYSSHVFENTEEDWIVYAGRDESRREPGEHAGSESPGLVPLGKVAEEVAIRMRMEIAGNRHGEHTKMIIHVLSNM